MKAPQGPKDKSSRIAIIGAGPAGLATAWFLKQHGFTDVTVFERHGRVGGLCFTLNEGYRSFDLGANYVTMAYRETLRIARAVGAKTYRARPYISTRIPENDDGSSQLPYTEMTQLVREIRDKDGHPTGELVGWIPFVLAILRYVVRRWQVRRAVDQPGFDRIHEHPGLCITFGAWLRANRLEHLRSLFEIPITLMGYGEIDRIAAPYALKYMSLGTFVPMVLRQIPFVGWLFPWPRRFVFGFQRLWEAVSWRLNVRTDVTIRHIHRYSETTRSELPADEAPDPRDPIRIDLEYPIGIFDRAEKREATLWFDHLVVASARVHSLLHQLDIDDVEHERMMAVDTYCYCMTTFHPQPGFRLPRPVVCVLPFRFEADPVANPPRPWAVVQLWGESTGLLQCYTKLPDEMARPEMGRDHMTQVLAGAEALVKRLGGTREGATCPKELRWEHYEQWPYFGYVGPEAMLGKERKPYFAGLAEMQGYRNTYWVGGATNFELVEVIVRAAKDLVRKHFLGKA